MPEYIERAAAIAAVDDSSSIYGDEIYASDAIENIEAIPAADVVEVVHGR